jgi:NTE family protein
MLSKLKSYFFTETVNKAKPETEPALPNLSMFEVLDASYDATLDRLVEVMLQLYPADVVIQIARNECSVFEFYRAKELIEAGRKAYTTAMDSKSKTNKKASSPPHEHTDH